MQRLRETDPETIGPYSLVARLGSGGMGTVFLGSLGTARVAIKVARQGFLDDPSLRTRFEREIATLQRLTSPYVARLLDGEVGPEMAWHAVEFVNGPTLKEKVDHDGPLNSSEWLLLAEQLRAVLDDLAAVGVVHRDLKPANIVISDTGIKLIDFGIALDSDQTSVTSTGMLAGSPAWLAPEQLDGAEITPATDMFSAGSVLVYAATGRSPWGDTSSTSMGAIVGKIASLQADLGGLSAEQHEVVAGLLHSDPRQRQWNLPLSTPSPSEKTPQAEWYSRQGAVEASDIPEIQEGEDDFSQPSVARQLAHALRFPAAAWALALISFALQIALPGPNDLFVSGALLLLVTSFVWLVVQVVRFFRSFGVSRAWLGAILAVPGWVFATLVGLVAIQEVIPRLFW